ncbi:MAG: NAD-dependent epimerase/dehydratase family protein, partial [Salinispira sp.]
MVIFVTNATGFVGSHLCRQLQEHNHEVIALVRNYKKFEKTGLSIKTVIGDLSPESVAGWVQELPPTIDAVIHNAGQVHAHRIKEFFQTNTQGTRNLVQELRKRYEKLHFLFISSVGAMGPSTETPLVETDPRMPVSCYGLSKKLAEEILDKYSPPQWTLTILTPAIVIGPGDPAMVDIFRMVYNRLFIGFGLNFRKKTYSFVSIFDLISATEKALFRGGNRKEAYFIAHPDACTSVTLIRT